MPSIFFLFFLVLYPLYKFRSGELSFSLFGYRERQSEREREGYKYVCDWMETINVKGNKLSTSAANNLDNEVV